MKKSGFIFRCYSPTLSRNHCLNTYLARSYRNELGNSREIVLKLGKLSQSEATHWCNLIQTLKQPNAFFITTNDIYVDQHFSYLDVVTINAAWDEW